VAVRCVGWDDTGWLSVVLFVMRLGGCILCWLGCDWVAVWFAGWNEIVWLPILLVGMRICTFYSTR